MACHDGSNPHLPNLNGYDNLKKVTEKDTGAAIATLVRVSHIHLFGLTFIFFIVGLMFSHAYVRPVWFKCTIVALPFVAIVVDVSSWYFIKIFHPFVLVEIAAGALIGGVLRLHVAGDHVSDVVHDRARRRDGSRARLVSDQACAAAARRCGRRIRRPPAKTYIRCWYPDRSARRVSNMMKRMIWRSRQL